MTRRDFELIADGIKRSRGRRDTSDQAGIIDTVAYELAASLAGTNPRFDRARFLAACGVEL